MSLQSSYGILAGDFMVTAGICVSLRRYVLKICFKVSDEYTEYWLSREKVVSCNLLSRLVDPLNCQEQYPWYRDKKERITSLSIFDGFFVIADCRYFEKAIYLYRDVGFFLQIDRAYVSPFSKLHFLNEQWQTRQIKGSVFTRTKLLVSNCPWQICSCLRAYPLFQYLQVFKVKKP